MKKYIKPAIEIVDIKVNSNILTGSDPDGVADKGLNGYDPSASQFGKGHTLWDFDDDEDEI